MLQEETFNNELHIKDIYPLTPMQEGILFHSLHDSKAGAYFMQVVFCLEGSIDFDLFQKSFQMLVDRHDALRTFFVYEDVERPLQVVLEKRHGSVGYVDISHLSNGECTAYLERFKKENVETGFDITKDMLMRILVVKTHKDTYNVIWSVHHIIMDGWCVGVLINEFLRIYTTLYKNMPVRLDKVHSYSYYIKWLESRNKEEGILYWKKYLEGYDQKAIIPWSASKEQKGSYKEEKIDFIIEPKLKKGLEAIAKKNHVTLGTILITLWGILLGRYNNTEDAVFGLVVSGRPPEITGIEKMIGLFINTIPIRISYDGSQSFCALLRKVQKESILSGQYHYIPLAEIQSNTSLGQGIFDNLMVFETFPVDRQAEANIDTGFRMSGTEVYEHTNYDFNILVLAAQELALRFSYNGHLYNKSDIERTGSHFVHLIRQVVENQDIVLKDLEIITPDEKDFIRSNFNNTSSGNLTDKTIHEMFENQALKTPEKIAIVFEGSKLSYRELDNKADSVKGLIKSNVETSPGIIAIMVDRSMKMIIGILGILKSGFAYLPIDPEYPEERIRYMLEDSGVSLLLTEQHLSSRIKDYNGRIILLGEEVSHSAESENKNERFDATEPVYIIYTSGSTGNPKGVILEHRNVANLINFEQNCTNVKFDTKILQYAPISFDVSFQEIFSTLLSGGELHLIGNDLKMNVGRLFEYIEEENIDTLFLPSSFVKFVLNEEEVVKNFPKTVKHIIVAGEQLVITENFKKHLSGRGIYLHNHYGPSETHVVTTLTMKVTEDMPELPSIGRPIWNTRIHILDRYMNQQPIGVAGELYIAGRNVGRGYLGKPELTKEKFVPELFGSTSNEGSIDRMYKSGDLARWLPDGQIEFLGRIDHQVKIRGFRVELGEIEACITKTMPVKEAVVIDRTDLKGNKYLCAYVTSDEKILWNEFKQKLAVKLPDYMVPSFLIQIEKMPINSNGKIDRKKLPEPEDLNNVRTDYVEPVGDSEIRLAKVWKEVLGTALVGRNHNFFELGGHSLKAMILCSKVQKEFGVHIDFKDVFKTGTLGEMAKLLENAHLEEYSFIKPAGGSVIEGMPGAYPLSPAQKRLFIVHQLNSGKTNYNMPMAARIKGNLDLPRLQKAFDMLIERHEALRTSFCLKNGEPLQHIHENAKLDVCIIEAKEDEIEGIYKEFVRPFDLSRAPLLRVMVVSTSDGNHVLLVDTHHIISDGISHSIMIRDFGALYSGKVLEPLRLQYKDFSQWQNNMINSGFATKKEEYWLEVYSKDRGEIPLLDMPLDFPRPAVQSFEGGRIVYGLGKELSDELYTITFETGTTLYMLLLAAFNVLLSKYTGQKDIVVGSPVAGRVHADLEDIVGVFINTLAIRNYPDETKTFKEFLNEVKESCLKAYDNQEYQFEELIDKIGVKRDLSRNPLFDVMFGTQDRNMMKVDIEGLEFNLLMQEAVASKFDLTLNALDTDGGIVFELTYCTRIFKKESMYRLLEHFTNILREVRHNMENRLSQINMLSEKENRQVIHLFNQTQKDFDEERTFKSKFEDQAAKFCANTAVICGTEKATYQELNEKAQKIAQALHKILTSENSKMKERIIAVIIKRSLDTVVGIIGVLKTGAAYLPIDSSYPEDRISYILKDSGAEVVLHHGDFGSGIAFEGKLLNIAELLKEEMNVAPGNPVNDSAPHDLAYVIYTSGSTGVPKGVMIETRNLYNYISWFTGKAELKEKDKVLLISSLCFDLGYTAFYPALLSGCELHVMRDEDALEPERILEYIKENNITLTKMTPSLFNMLLNTQSFSKEGVLSSLRLIVLGGESINVQDLETFNRRYPSCIIMNHYGPTETTIGAIAQKIDFSKFSEYKQFPALGKPIDNVKIYILDSSLKPVPLGVTGEIYISGMGVARGYLNRPELDRIRFLQDTFQPGERMYKTGDLGRWLQDGSVEFRSRIDDQVKIRGYRVELGEIENHLLEEEGINEVLVTLKEDAQKNKNLCAYFVSEKELTVSELRKSLARNLPEYMIPGFFIRLKKMPLTANCKVDLKALPEPEESLGLNNQYRQPENEIEERLASIWQELLKVGRVGRADNFFEIGGHSLKATMLTARVHKEFNVILPLREVFRAPYIKDLAGYIKKATQNIYLSIKPAEKKEFYPLSSAQMRVYITEKLREVQSSYNVSNVILVEGKLDYSRLESAFRELVNRHEMLRTSFHMVEGEPVQHIHEHMDFRVHYSEDLQHYNSVEELQHIIGNVIYEFVKPFDLAKAPLFRVEMVKLGDEKHLLLVDMHHIISDAVSVNIITEEFIHLYNQEKLPKLKLQYKDYAVWQKERVHEDAVKRQEEYWLDVFKGEIPVLKLPTDFPRPLVLSSEGKSITHETGIELLNQLKEIAQNNGVSLYMVLFSAFNILLSKYTCQEDIIVGTPVAGRPHQDLENIIGIFINTLAMRNFPGRGMSFEEFLKSVKDNSLNALENQEYQFEDLVHRLGLPRNPSRNVLFDTMFVMQNAGSGIDSIEGLSFRSCSVNNKTAKFDILMDATETKNGIVLKIEYITALFKRETIEKMLHAYIKILKIVTGNPLIRIGDIILIGEEERNHITAKIQNSKKDLDFDFDF